MKTVKVLSILLLLVASSQEAVAIKPTPFKAQSCYAQMQVAKDTLINASLGVPMSHIIAIGVDITYFKIMFGAYFFDGNADEYALQIYSECMGDSVVL